MTEPETIRTYNGNFLIIFSKNKHPNLSMDIVLNVVYCDKAYYGWFPYIFVQYQSRKFKALEKYIVGIKKTKHGKRLTIFYNLPLFITQKIWRYHIDQYNKGMRKQRPRFFYYKVYKNRIKILLWRTYRSLRQRDQEVCTFDEFEVVE